VYLKQGSAALSGIGIFDRTASLTRHRVTVTWTAGVPSLSTLDGAGTLYPVEALANGWYRILISATGVVAANTNALFVYPAGYAAVAGTVYAWGAQAEDAVVPSSYIKTEGTTVTRNADSLYFPFTAPPQAMTVYCRQVVRGSLLASGQTARFLHIGGATSTTGNGFTLLSSTTGGVQARYSDTTTPVLVGTGASGAVRGDVMEVRGVLRSDWAAQVGYSRNGAAEVVSSVSSASGPAASFEEARIYLAGNTENRANAYTHVLVAAGEQSLSTMRQLAGVV
jgi:hypothetical protein